ncbi:SIR2 family protein [Lysinibacillus piscis]|uniref:Novel STAND NTPase 5 domain-containing protein n=1 Tax=Lysinibacillus piscis TaxID=2518931 RepID=A0ABQ5NNN0_9BACI|nr:SIR2 family protein [Lysinibacillus sp. KH24]GLC89691.1 hypothetical protein LYSBPC_28180 [Lysinibacillus sp. KH24]
MLEVKYDALFKEDLKSTINLFTGAGFSIYAENEFGKKLPLADELKDLLIEEFSSLPLSKDMDLPMVCMLISSEYPEEYREFLTKTFKVKSLNPIYFNLNKLNIKHFYTTNIDNIASVVVSENSKQYLNDIYINSINKSPQAINYFPVHGSVENAQSEYIFDTIQLADTGNDSNIGFTVLTSQLLEVPTIFIGYSFKDLFAWRSLKKILGKNENGTNMWVLIRREELSSAPFYEKLGFKILIGDTKDFLEYLEDVEVESSRTKLVNILPEYSFEKLVNTTSVRKVEDFFEGFEPTWNQITQSDIKMLSFLYEIENLCYKNKHIVVTGMIFSGKTTVGMQLLYRFINSNKPAYFLRKPPTLAEAKWIIKSVNEVELDSKPILIIDDFCSSFEGVELLMQSKKVQIIAFDRFYNYDSLHSRFEKYNIEYFEITEISNADLSLVWDSIPFSIKNRRKKFQVLEQSKTIFEVVDGSLKHDEQVVTRVRKMLQSLKSNKKLLELLVLAAYFQRAKSYLSMDVLIAYFNTGDYSEIYSLIQALKDQIIGVSNEEILHQDQDYYVLRSTIYAYKIIGEVDKETLSEVIMKVATNVPNSYIYRYDIFRKYAYDSELIKKGFWKLEDGIKLYNIVYDKQPNMYLYQHAAIYARDKNDFESAFKYINKAMGMSYKRVFSIHNVYATILFKSNIGKDIRYPDVREQIRESMSILESCIEDSLGKAYHAVTYGKQSIEYFKKVNDEVAFSYLEKAKKILNQQLVSLPDEQKKNKKDVERTLKEINKIVKLPI